MAVEPRRGCGYRKVGGLYLVGGGAGAPCCKLPILLDVCPCCGGGIKQSRGWTWIDPRPFLKKACEWTGICPAADPAKLGEKVGLIWIGEGFYPTADSFIEEANKLGISRRIKAVPRGFKLGEHWVFLAHPKIGELPSGTDEPPLPVGGIFRIFKPTRIEKIVTESQAADADEMAKLEKAGITPFVVPDNDKDHQGSVYDREPAQRELELA